MKNCDFLKMVITSWKEIFFSWCQKRKHYLRSYLSKKLYLYCVTRDFEKNKWTIVYFLVKILHFRNIIKTCYFWWKYTSDPPAQRIKKNFVRFLHKIECMVIRIDFMKKLDKKNNFRANARRFTSAKVVFSLKTCDYIWIPS